VVLFSIFDFRFSIGRCRAGVIFGARLRNRESRIEQKQLFCGGDVGWVFRVGKLKYQRIWIA